MEMSLNRLPHQVIADRAYSFVCLFSELDCSALVPEFSFLKAALQCASMTSTYLQVRLKSYHEHLRRVVCWRSQQVEQQAGLLSRYRELDTCLGPGKGM